MRKAQSPFTALPVNQPLPPSPPREGLDRNGEAEPLILKFTNYNQRYPNPPYFP